MSVNSEVVRELPADGLLRASEVLQYLPIRKSTWWAGVRSGIYPQPVRLSRRTVAWRATDIRHLIDHGIEI
ncbi:helix-turn-helix transcriptional regulator [Desulfoplanes sp. PS50]|jgi:predicted DNA-binding transcriptional regulator AlpA